ncbi:methylated-DNA--[protein]-cysteine S-methyltransferase [Chloroflexota bacterium]
MSSKQSKNSVYYAKLSPTPLGTLWVAVSERGVWALDFGIEETQFLELIRSRGAREIIPNTEKTQLVLQQVSEYLSGSRRGFDLAIDWEGMTEFTRSARTAVVAVPYGQTRSYGQIADHIGRPGASRAVGRANATNPIPLVIPCHRVIGADGGLRGYGAGAGLETKRWLLELEAANSKL